MKRIIASLLAALTPWSGAGAAGFGTEQREEIVAVVREALKKDPSILRDAIDAAVPAPLRDQLPSEIRALLESRVAGKGDLNVIAGIAAPGGPAPNPVKKRAGNQRHAFFAWYH